MTWLANKLFGPLFSALLDFAPWLWLLLGVLALTAMFFTDPWGFQRRWKLVGGVTLAGFFVLLLLSGIDTGKTEKIDKLQTELKTAEQSVTNLQTSIQSNEKAVARYEGRQREIRQEVAEALEPLDPVVIMETAKDDPVQAASDLTDRYNDFGRMFDDATDDFGPARSSAAPGPSADPDERGFLGRLAPWRRGPD